jgi:hypothetical protein
MSKELPEIIEKFLTHSKGYFTVAAVFDAASELAVSDAAVISELDQFLNTHNEIFSDFKKGFFITKKAFFNELVFSIRLSKIEKKYSILVPGERFIPFYSGKVNPLDFVLYKGNKKLPLKEVSLDAGEYALLAAEDAFAEKHSTDCAIKGVDEDRKILLQAFDLSVLLSGSYINDDLVFLRIKNWENGSFSLIKDADLSTLSQQDDTLFIKSLYRAFDHLGLPVSIHEQLAWACFFSGREYFSVPLPPLSGLIRKNKNIALVNIGIQKCLWKKEEKTAEKYFTGHTEDKNSIADAVFEDILHSVNSYFFREDIIAYILDELFHRQNSCRNVLKRCQLFSSAAFQNQNQKNFVERYIRRLFTETAENYNSLYDEKSGYLRRRLLELMDIHLKLLKKAESMEAIKELSDTFSQLSILACTLNHYTELSADELKSIETSLENFADAEINLLKRFSTALKAESRNIPDLPG